MHLKLNLTEKHFHVFKLLKATTEVDSVLLVLMNSKRQQLGNRESAFLREVTGPKLRTDLGNCETWFDSVLISQNLLSLE